MSLSLSRVTSVWAFSLADLPQVPEEKLQVLLRVCLGDSGGAATGGAGAPKDAADVLQRVLPLTVFLEKSQGKVRRGLMEAWLGTSAPGNALPLNPLRRQPLQAAAQC